MGTFLHEISRKTIRIIPGLQGLFGEETLKFPYKTGYPPEIGYSKKTGYSPPTTGSCSISIPDNKLREQGYPPEVIMFLQSMLYIIRKISLINTSALLHFPVIKITLNELTISV